MTEQTTSEPQTTIDSLQLTMKSDYVKPTGELPAKRNEWKLNWRCVVSRGNAYAEFEYFQGIGHLDKYYPKKDSYDTQQCIRQSVLTGGLYRMTSTIGMIRQKPHATIPEPSITDVLYCVVLDSSAIHETFSDWCAEFGYSDDSISARNTYDACCDNARKLIRLVGVDGLAKLQTAFQDY